MFLFLDSNYRNALSYGGRQIGSVFPESVQLGARNCSDRAATVAQISYCLRPLPTDRRVAIVFGGFENFSTGARSVVQLAPLEVMKTEIASYASMVRDILVLYPQVSVYLLPPLYRSLPKWFASTYEALMPLFLSSVSHIDTARVLVVPPIHVAPLDLDYDGVHVKPPSLQRMLDMLLTTFRDGVFVRPGDYPLPEPDADGEFCMFFETLLFSALVGVPPKLSVHVRLICGYLPLL